MAGRTEVLRSLVEAVIERLLNVLMPSLGTRALAQMKALEEEDQRLVALQGAPANYHEIPE